MWTGDKPTCRERERERERVRRVLQEAGDHLYWSKGGCCEIVIITSDVEPALLNLLIPGLVGNHVERY